MKLNREQIVNALECCKDRDCANCVFLHNNIPNEDDCRLDLIRHALALIRELTKEKERYDERLGREAKCQYDLATQIVDLKEEVAQAKADTVRKMQERLKKEAGYFGRAVAVEDIDKIAKEMLEEKE